MIHRSLGFLFSAGLLAVAAACSRPPDGARNKTGSTTQSAEGTVTPGGTKRVGATLEARSETGVGTRSGTIKSKTETTVGTVTFFTAGKRLEVMTGEKTLRSFSLDERNVLYSIDSTVTVGRRVTVIDGTGDDHMRHVTVKLGP